MGVHPFRDPALTEEFAREELPIDVTEPHLYAADVDLAATARLRPLEQGGHDPECRPDAGASDRFHVGHAS